jgi:hypothetical protein
VELGAYVIMPNHVHGIIVINTDHVGAQHIVPFGYAAPLPLVNVKPGSLGAIVRSYKSAVTKQINVYRNTPTGKCWQRNYHACPEPVEGTASSATTAKWKTSGVTSKPTRRAGTSTAKTRATRRGETRLAPMNIAPTRITQPKMRVQYI